MNIKKHLNILGYKCRDRVTGISGVATSVCFDLYGCVQATLNRGLDKDGKPYESFWFDIARLEVADPNPVMLPPDYEFGEVAEGKKGPAEKPQSRNI